jgi:ABC-2 type transport system permease protein
MSNVGVIFRREFRGYFDSTIAYIFVIVYLLLNAGFFMSGFFLGGEASLRAFFGNLPLFNIFFLPAITMGLWANEQQDGTFELLMTLPMKSWQVVTGKYLASLAFYTVALACTFTLPLMVTSLGNADPGPIFTGYVGALLLGAFYLALGIFISGLFQEQIAAFIVTCLACLLLLLLGNEMVVAGIDGWVAGLGSFLRDHVAFGSHWDSLQRGVIDFNSILYFLTMPALFLGLNAISLERRRY